MIWKPDKEWREESNIGKWLAERNQSLDQFQEFTWKEPETFWPSFLERVGVNFRRKPEKVLDLSRGREWSKWFVGSRLNVTD
ncbi:MAG: acetyl-coenzyme A synthetase N-terminal domain-containing protein, partial [Metallosphaera sp.]